MKSQFTLVTGNKNKINEFTRFFGESVSFITLDLPEIQSLDEVEIATYKLHEARKHVPTGMIAVEDSGVYFGGFKDIFPGPFAKWFEQSQGIEHIYDLLGHRDDATIRYTATISIITDTHEIHSFRGEVSGTLCSYRGTNGFGCDPIFMPYGSSKSFAEMTIEEKSTVSHRGLAMQKLQTWLTTI